MATVKRLPPAAGMGRKPGSRNKTTRAIREMILHALDQAGGEEYLVRLAKSEPKTFCTLLAKIIPPEPAEQSDGGGGFTIILNGALTDSDEGVNP